MEIDKWIHIKMTWLSHNFRWLGEFLDDLVSRWAEMLTDIETVRLDMHQKTKRLMIHLTGQAPEAQSSKAWPVSSWPPMTPSMIS
jgi:hypothetical protein